MPTPRHATLTAIRPSAILSPAVPSPINAGLPPQDLSEDCTICNDTTLEDALDCRDGHKSGLGSLDCCDHLFCHACISRWVTDCSSTCPLCKRDAHKLIRRTRCPVPDRLGMRKIVADERELAEREARGRLDELSEADLERLAADDEASGNCTECGTGDDDHLILLCDSCNSGYHSYCVGLGRTVPDGDWFCPVCAIVHEPASAPPPAPVAAPAAAPAAAPSVASSHAFGGRSQQPPRRRTPATVVEIVDSCDEESKEDSEDEEGSEDEEDSEDDGEGEDDSEDEEDDDAFVAPRPSKDRRPRGSSSLAPSGSSAAVQRERKGNGVGSQRSVASGASSLLGVIEIEKHRGTRHRHDSEYRVKYEGLSPEAAGQWEPGENVEAEPSMVLYLESFWENRQSAPPPPPRDGWRPSAGSQRRQQARAEKVPKRDRRGLSVAQTSTTSPYFPEAATLRGFPKPTPGRAGQRGNSVEIVCVDTPIHEKENLLTGKAKPQHDRHAKKRANPYNRRTVIGDDSESDA